jgi:hypothetical protein
MPLLALEAFKGVLKDADVTLSVADPENVTYLVGGVEEYTEELC